MVHSESYVQLNAKVIGSLRNLGEYRIAFQDGSVCHLGGLALSTGSAVQSCEGYCGLYGVVSCSYYLHDGREVCRSVVR